MHIKIFHDNNLNEELLDQGYVKIKLFNDKELKKIKTLFKKLNYRDKHDNKTTLVSLPKSTLNHNVDNKLQKEFKNIVDEKLTELFDVYEYFHAALLLKKRRQGRLDWHYDPSFYKENIFPRPIAIWGTVDKTKHDDGNLMVIPKSHKLCLPISPLPIFDKNYFKNLFNLDKLIKSYATPITLEAGEVIVHDQGLLHASTKRTSFFSDRLAFKITLVPKIVDSFQMAWYNQDDHTIENYSFSKELLQLNAPYCFKMTITQRKSLLMEGKYQILDSQFNTLSEKEANNILNEPIFSLNSNTIFNNLLKKMT